MFKIKKLLAAALSACLVAAALPSAFVLADGTKVVTLGADLSEEQKTMILQYFGVEGESIDTLTINNDDEREHLGAYVPLEQIGTRTYSCALVNPTTSGGIQVKTANLTWVTSNMIAATLSTSGVVNCDVVAASPFPVSGTGALTGVIMAYESASGETLDPEKTDAANQELVTTATIGDHIGAPEATLVVNETKEQVIEGNVVDTGDITEIVNNVTEENNITLEQDDEEMLVDLLEQIAQLEYDIEDMKATLDRVESNVNAEINGTASDQGDQDQPAEDSILNNTDPGALGGDTEEDSTVPETEAPEAGTEDSAGEVSDDSDSETLAGFEIFNEDSYASDSADTEASASDTEEPAPDTEAPVVPDTEEVPAEEPGTVEPEPEETNAESPAQDDGETPADDQNGTPDETPEEPSGDAEDQMALDEGGEDGAEPEPDGSEEGAEAEEQPDEAVYYVDEFAFVPDEEAAPGLNVVSILSDNLNLSAGSGTITVMNETTGSEVETTSLNDESKVVSHEITDPELLESLDFDEGIAYDIYLSSQLDADTDYSVSVSDDAFEILNVALIGGETVWSFHTQSFGIGLMDDAAGIKAGEDVSGTVYLDSLSAGYAVIDGVTIDEEDVTDMVSLSQGEFTETGSFQISFPHSGEACVHVTFYDTAGEDGNYVDEADTTITIVEEP